MSNVWHSTNEKLLPKKPADKSINANYFDTICTLAYFQHMASFSFVFIVFINYLFTLAIIFIYLEQIFILNRALKFICIVQSLFMLLQHIVMGAVNYLQSHSFPRRTAQIDRDSFHIIFCLFYLDQQNKSLFFVFYLHSFHLIN